MPLKIWTRDMVPELTVEGGRALAAGVSGGVESLVRGFTQAAEERKRLGQVAKGAEGFVKSLSDDERGALNIPDADTFALMGAKEKIGTVTGALQAQGYKRAHQEMAVRAQQIKRWQDEDSNRSLEPGALANLAQLGGAAPEDVPAPVNNAGFDRMTAPVTPAAQLAALSRNGYRPSLEHIAPLMRALQPGKPVLPIGEVRNLQGGGRLIGTGGAPHFAPDEGAQDAEGNFTEDPETGNRFYNRGKQVMPSGVNPTRSAEPVPQLDENGTLIGHVVKTGGRAGIFVKATLPDRLTAAQKLKALTSQYSALVSFPSLENKAAAAGVHEEIQGLLGGGGAGGAAPAPGAVSAPADAGKRTKGAVYLTPRGALKWTGTGWVNP